MPTLQSGDLLISKFCTSYLSGTSFETCDRWDTYISVEYLGTIEQTLTSGIMYGGIILLVISMVVYLLKILLSRLFHK